MNGVCRLSGFGANEDPAYWRVQLILCGTEACRTGVNLPDTWDPNFPPCGPPDVGPTSNCVMSPIDGG